MTRETPVLVDRVRSGDRGALARLLTLIESDAAEANAAVEALTSGAGLRAHVIGITGAPGVGKSTLSAAIAIALRAHGGTVAILAFDPTSPVSGGALLGDRIRMGALHGDPGAFVRSMASRGGSGALSDCAASSAALLAAAGFEHVLIETVGAGQGELDVSAVVDTTVVVVSPGLGDGVQALKAGILEIADVLVVNKADRDGAGELVADLTFAMTRGAGEPGTPLPGDWRVPLLETVATDGTGIAEVVSVMAEHRAWREGTAGGAARRRAAAHAAVLRFALQAVRARLQLELEHNAASLADDVLVRRTTASAAAARLLHRVGFLRGARPAEAGGSQ